MEFVLLGPVGFTVDGRSFEVRTDKARCLIAVLALEAGRPVALDTLVDRLWDGDPPKRARDGVHQHVSRARGQLRDAALAAKLRKDDVPAIALRAHTYTLVVDPVQVDRYKFRQFCQDARAAAARGDDERAVALLVRARSLWRGEPLAGLP